MTNESGLVPVEFKVLVAKDEVEQRTKGGLFIPEPVRLKEEREEVEGTLVAVGGLAFSEPDWGAPKPVVGDRVLYSKYAGITRTGRDGKRYQLLQDREIVAMVARRTDREYLDSDQPDGAGDGIYAHLRADGVKP